MKRIKEIFQNRWVKFSLAAIVYTLMFVVWTGNPWLLLGLPVIYDIYISRYFYRYVGYRNTQLRERSKSYNTVFTWVWDIGFALIAVTIIQIFFFAQYQIPTPSMEKTLLVGDYLCVSKVAYGPRMPNTPVAVPLVHHTMPFSQTKRSFTEAIYWPYHRLKGFRPIKRNDIVVFNYPEGDTVILSEPGASYYDALRIYGKEYVAGSEIISRPVDRRENYVKRCVALPGDTIRIVHSQVYVNGEPQEKIPGLQYSYYIRTNGTGFNPEVLSDMGIAQAEVQYSQVSGVYYLPLTEQNLEKIKSFGNVEEVVKAEAKDSPYGMIYPHSPDYPWTEDNFGPLWVPSKGSTVELNLTNLPLYERIIRVYEGNELSIRDSLIHINGTPATSYTFKMDYYFMMGDNRHNSLDSRFWGFVPEDHVVGTPSFVWLSLDKEKKFPANIRWNRMFRRIK